MAIIKKEIEKRIKGKTVKGYRLVVRGWALWPRLTEPDTKFDEGGVYSVRLILDEDDVSPVRELLEEVRALAVAGAVAQAAESGKTLKADKVKRADLPLKELEDRETGEGTGEFGLNAKLKAVGRDRKGNVYERKVALFDAKGQPLPPQGLNIWNGSILKLNLDVMPYFTGSLGAGASVALNAVQIIELVSGSPKEAADYDFEAEDGYAGGEFPASPAEAFEPPFDQAAATAEADF